MNETDYRREIQQQLSPFYTFEDGWGDNPSNTSFNTDFLKKTEDELCTWYTQYTCTLLPTIRPYDLSTLDINLENEAFYILMNFEYVSDTIHVEYYGYYKDEPKKNTIKGRGFLEEEKNTILNWMKVL